MLAETGNYIAGSKYVLLEERTYFHYTYFGDLKFLQNKSKFRTSRKQN